ncbi:PAS domain S-box protein [Desulfonatronum thioautotrophicum]|uniref:PAS domain S-box protein n=1 Tax=Desulfonatronum thioautotrophicum TaxID=617001 RepID=UPI0005EB3839|nr:PAS domain S-box protein [Desulfonatronum thioautotrophicum]
MAQKLNREITPMHQATSEAVDVLMDAPIGIFTSTPEGRFLRVNSAMATMYGYASPEEMCAEITDIARQLYVNPADRFQILNLESHSSTRPYQSLQKRKDGSTFWIAETVRMVRGERGKVRHIQGFVMDISSPVQVGPASKKESLLDKECSHKNDSQANDRELELKNIVDRSTIQELMTVFAELTGIGVALLDMKGHIMASTGWEDICLNFHRAHPETNQNCMESDNALSRNVAPGQYKIYRCRNNMLDIVMPIMVEGKHMGNLFTGQFFFKDEPPNHEIFKAQAVRYGFDAEQYLAALKKVPLLERDTVTKALLFYGKLSEIICTMGYNNVVLARSLKEREKLFASLRESEEKHRRLFETMTQGVVYQAADASIISANPAAEKILGLTLDQIHGKTSMDPCWKMIKEDGSTVEGSEHPVMIALRTGEVHGPVVRGVFVPEKNTHVWLSITAIPLFQTGEARPFQAYAMFEDITSRKQAEEALRRSENLLRKVFEILPIGLWIADKNGALLQGNPAGVAIWGAQPIVDQKDYGIFKARKLPSREQIKPDDWALAHTVNKGVTVVDELLEIDTLDGKKKTILNYTAPVLDENGAIEAAIIVNQDITDRMRAEEALRKSEERFRLSMEATSDGIWDWDIQTDHVYYSPGYVRMLGYEIIEVPRHVTAWTDLIHPDDKQAAFKANMDCIENRVTSFAVEFRMQARNGEWRWILGRGRAVERDASGRAIRLIGTHQDITERKRTEQERERMQAQLLQAQKMESVGILAGGVAHDFNNLLQVMRGNIELLLQELPKNHQYALRLNIVMHSMDRATQLVQQLLLFSRKVEANKVPVDVNQEVKSTVRMLERTIPKMVALALNFDPEVWPVLGDPVQIEQVLLNLANNAVDAMPEGGQLTIETSNVVLQEQGAGDSCEVINGGRHVLLKVSDTGCGMDQIALKHVFDPFFTTKAVDKGSGLGLASVYGIVKAHGGHIYCDSQPGAGTSFRVYLPALEHDKAVTAVSQPETSHQENVPLGRNATILVVDDDPQIRELTQEALEMLGYTIMLATTGEEALAIYQEQGQTIDLVLLDLNMPGMGGNRCLQELLRLDPQVKVVIASGYTSAAHGRDALILGARKFLGKPYRLQELAKVVRDVIDERGNNAQH